MSTPNLTTFVRSQQSRREVGIQTAFPAKVTSYSASSNTVEIEPQFVEAWTTRDGTRKTQEPDKITNVPCCFPRHMSWTVDTGDFGLVICTKYSLDRWRNERNVIDPGDLRRFTLSGATFHPVLMDETPVTQQFVALANLVNQELSNIKDALDTHTHLAGGYTTDVAVTGVSGTKSTQPYTAGDVGSTIVKVSE